MASQSAESAPTPRSSTARAERTRGRRAARIVPVLVTVLLAALAVATAASASSLKEQRYREAQNAAFDREVEYTNKLCGSSITARIDWDTLSPLATDINRNLYTQCGAALSAIERMCLCGGSDRVRDHIAALVCTGGLTRSLALDGTQLTYVISSEPSSDFDRLVAFLESALGARQACPR